MPKMFPPGK